MTPAPRPLNVVILGFGTVGRAVARIVCESRHPGLRLAGICTRRAEQVRRETPWVPADIAWTESIDEALDTRAGVVVEVLGGLDPARDWIERALLAERSVVTANKQVVAEHGPELVALARAMGRSLRFEAAVGGVIPVIRGVQEGLSGDRLTRIAAVVSGTCNFVLTRMEQDGLSFGDAVADAQARGFAEANPAIDLDGLDARAKLVILTAVGLGTHLRPCDVPAESIRPIERVDLAYAHTLGCVIRQVAWAERVPGHGSAIRASVAPALVRRASWLAGAQGSQNVVQVSGERSGHTVFMGQGAGGEATAVAIVSDLLAIAHGPDTPRRWPDPGIATVAADFVAAHYVRVSSTARKGGACPAAVLQRFGIETRDQLRAGGDTGPEWAAVVHPCSHRLLGRALGTFAPAGGGARTAVGLPLIDAA